MRIFPAILFVTLLASAVPSQVCGSIVLDTVTPAGSASILHSGNVRFQNLRHGFDVTVPDLIVGKTFGPGVFDVDLDFSYASGDLHAAGILRFSEQITNLSGAAWSDFTVTLTGPGTFFTDYPGGTFFAPTFATINLGTTPPEVTSDDLPGPGGMDSFGTVSPSPPVAGSKTLTFTFDTPLLPGESFGLHIPIENLPNAGSFQVGQAANVAVPEATSVVVWSMLSLVACCTGCGRRRRVRS